jgi:hypothetical protein
MFKRKKTPTTTGDNMSIIRDLIEIEKVFTKNKKTPCDIAAALEEELYSESKGEDIKLGDMHLTHYIRRQLKDERADDEIIKKLNKKIRHLKEFIRLNIE